jgi:hypothetical protein
MSRTSISAFRPRRGGTYRPQLEALEHRFAPGSLVETPVLPFTDLGSSLAANQRDAADLALLVAAATSQPAATPSLSSEAAPPINPGPPPATHSAPPRNAQAPTVTTRPVVDFATRSIVFGESTLKRTAHGVTAHLTASGLAPGAYTFWTRVDAPGMGPVSGWLAGHVVGESGILNFSAHVGVGEVLSGNPHLPSGPLQDPLHATITLVVRNHGPADPGRIYEQTHTFEPGLDTDGDPTTGNFLISIHAPPP